MHDDILIKKEKVFLTNYISKTNNIYGLPNIPKSEEIKIAVER